MKNKFFGSLIITGIVSIGLLSSCAKKIDEAYLNPNAGVVQPIEAILPGVIGGFSTFNSAAGTNYGVIVDGTFVGRYIQYFGINTSADTWGQMSMLGGAVDNGGSVWATVYYAQGANVNRIIQWGTEQQKWDYVGAGLAIRAWGWLKITEEYNYGILKEAFNSNLTTFHYDEPADFFDSTRSICHQAIEFLSRTDGAVSPANFAIGDAYFYGGNTAKWKKFVYGILARSYIDLSFKNIFVSESYADSAIKYASLAMTTNADNATVKVSGGLNAANNQYWGPYRGNFGTYRQGQYIADLMQGVDSMAFPGIVDPRAWYMLSENLSLAFKGLKPWLGNSSLDTFNYPKNFWRYAPPVGANNRPNVYSTAVPPVSVDSTRYLYQNTAPWPMMTASEMKFIIAEAAFRKGDKPLALQAYKDGISLHFDMLSVDYPQNIPAGKSITPTIKQGYLDNTVIVPLSANNLTLTHIMNQKYIALYIWGTLETWVDMRKFHYTDIDPMTSKKVYPGFALPSGANLISTNNGELTYRMRPRFNSEYLYNVSELTRIGAYQFTNYNTFKPWFAVP